MKIIHVPAGGVRYWLALCLASILGCNTGDLFASFFGLLYGFPILVALFVLCLLAERHDERPRQVYYWLAIIVVRTAATNLADFATGRLGSAALVVLALLLVTVLLGRRVLVRASSARNPATSELPEVDWLYWATMLVAGTLGTAIGDYASFHAGWGLRRASLALSALVILLVGLGTARFFAFTLYYWAVVVAIRAAGTAAGDYFASLLGLWQSALVFAILLIVLLVFWNERPLEARTRPRPASMN